VLDALHIVRDILAPGFGGALELQGGEVRVVLGLKLDGPAAADVQDAECGLAAAERTDHGDAEAEFPVIKDLSGCFVRELPGEQEDTAVQTKAGAGLEF